MPLEILLPMVVIGILGVALLLHLSGNSEKLDLISANHAKDLWNHRNPDHMALSAELSSGKHQALITTEDGLGLIWSFGSDYVDRSISLPARCRTTKWGLSVMTGDFTAPDIRLTLADPAQATRWKTLLEDHPK